METFLWWTPGVSSSPYLAPNLNSVSKRKDFFVAWVAKVKFSSHKSQYKSPGFNKRCIQGTKGGI